MLETLSLKWKLTDIKGSLSGGYSQDDIVSCIRFNHSGSKFVCGDRGGRCVVFEREGAGNYEFVCTFQSHDDCFDSLKSESIDKRINAIEWLDVGTSSDMFISTNDRSMKLWKIGKRRPQYYEKFNLLNTTTADPKVSINLKHEYKDGHSFHINSVSMNSDQQTFLSSDELRINIWDLNVTGISFVCVDIKPADLNDCTEVIQVSKFHPKSCNLFAYGLNSGVIKLCDMRAKAHCDYDGLTLKDDNSVFKNSIFRSFVSGVSALEFSKNDYHLFARDFMNIKLYDIRYSKNPISNWNVHEQLNYRLPGIFSEDVSCDPYDVNLSPDEQFIVVGSFGTFKMIDRDSQTELTYDIAHAKISKTSGYFNPKRIINSINKYRRPKVSDEIIFRNIDLKKKISLIWNPKHNELIASCTKNIYIFAESDGIPDN